jgi:hypothetical protein
LAGLGEEFMLVFADWLVHQQQREDAIGDLARVLVLQTITQKVSNRRIDEHKNWADIVTKSDTPGHIFAFNDAWQEFLRAKHAADKAGH